MTRKLLTLGTALLLTAGLLQGSLAAATFNDTALTPHPSALPDHVPGEVLVRFAPSVSAQSQSGMLSQMASSTKTVGKQGLTLVHLNSQYASVQSAISSLSGMPGVVSVQPNYIYRAQATIVDPQLHNQWALENTGQTIPGATYSTSNPGTSGDDISAKQAWNYVSDCSSVTVAVLDTGVNYTQQDLAANMWNGGTSYPHHGYDFVGTDINNSSDVDNDPMPMGGAEQHGTHVAGIIGAVGNNGIEGSGVCQKASIMAVRVLGPDGSGYTSTIASGIYFAVDHGAKVLNMSIGGTANDPALEDAIKYAQSHGVIAVVAAGNSSSNNDSTPSYPCNYPEDNLICVAAVDQSFNLASFSNYGATSVDVGAPGTNYLSTMAGKTLTPATWTPSTTTSGGWLYDNSTYTVPVMSDPLTFNLNNPSATTYHDNSDDQIWGTVDLSAANVPNFVAAALTYQAYWLTQPNDYLNAAFDTTSTTPFGSSTATTVQHSSGNSTLATNSQGPFDMASCQGITCSIGFQLISDATPNTNTGGALIADAKVQTVQGNTGVMGIENGTSMATPVASGIAAMLMSFKPGDSYHQVVDAIRYGGTNAAALSGKTVSGKVVNAMGSLAYISLTMTGIQNLTLTTGASATENLTLGSLGSSFTVTASSSNQALLPDSAITGQSNCTTAGPCAISLTTNAGAYGTSVVTLTMTDGQYGTQHSYSFTVNVPAPAGGGGGAMAPWMLILLAVFLAIAYASRRERGLS